MRKGQGRGNISCLGQMQRITIQDQDIKKSWEGCGILHNS